MDISSDLQVTKTIITIVSNTFLSIENYVNIVEFDTNLIRIKTKEKVVKITGDKLVLKYINEGEIGIKGIIYSLEYVD
ncbi:YabP/YqfC family sporulation protein [Intestinibacter bartlettii]|uniref:YabP/YqfC family sporulation protein n=1 Tax=Intestinibacter bartlettii TaxID=261299 RepID=A0ABS6DXB5_9FIRM|nr:YabP/YqfC family sporulation protein [Intestinibacter bartlettii]MBU5336493.1 YabP/YqfC family sporulation protein [Intestinibacter bartlettii]MDO5010124.1 YabP/YqfC family sporulation protein [Intestinibacter bartlettii]